MSGGGLIIGIGMLLIGLAYLALPFLRGGKATSEQARERLNMIAAYERALMTVRDLDEDYQVGKLSEEAYTAERTRWTEHGVTLLQLLEVNEPKTSHKQRKSVETTLITTNDDPVEQAIAAYVRTRDGAHERVKEKS